jgi:hypothetical protein
MIILGIVSSIATLLFGVSDQFNLSYPALCGSAKRGLIRIIDIRRHHTSQWDTDQHTIPHFLYLDDNYPVSKGLKAVRSVRIAYQDTLDPLCSEGLNIKTEAQGVSQSICDVFDANPNLPPFIRQTRARELAYLVDVTMKSLN